jgi:hypothetical protein
MRCSCGGSFGGEGEEDALEVLGGDLDVAGRRLGEEVARDGIRVLRVDADAVAGELDVVDAGRPASRAGSAPGRVARTMRPETRFLISAVEPSATMRPRLISTMRSAYSSASSR